MCSASKLKGHISRHKHVSDQQKAEILIACSERQQSALYHSMNCCKETRFLQSNAFFFVSNVSPKYTLQSFLANGGCHFLYFNSFVNCMFNVCFSLLVKKKHWTEPFVRGYFPRFYRVLITSSWKNWKKEKNQEHQVAEHSITQNDVNLGGLWKEAWFPLHCTLISVSFDALVEDPRGVYFSG